MKIILNRIKQDREDVMGNEKLTFRNGLGMRKSIIFYVNLASKIVETIETDIGML